MFVIKINNSNYFNIRKLFTVLMQIHLSTLSCLFIVSILLYSGNQIAALSQMSWLMKTAAIELRVTSLNRQRSHTQRLVSLLLDDQPHTQHTGKYVVKC